MLKLNKRNIRKVIDQDWIHIDCETPVIALPDRVITGHLTVRVDPMLKTVQIPVDHVVNQFCVSTTNVQLPEHIVNENIAYPCHLYFFSLMIHLNGNQHDWCILFKEPEMTFECHLT